MQNLYKVFNRVRIRVFTKIICSKNTNLLTFPGIHPTIPAINSLQCADHRKSRKFFNFLLCTKLCTIKVFVHSQFFQKSRMIV